jgi:flagellar biosynthesis/type III secretory pathway protein FliH
MKDVIEFQSIRITALMNEVDRLKRIEQELSQYVLELCDVDCPREYKRIIKKEILTNG